MNGVDRADVLVQLKLLVLRLEQDRDQAGLPVVAVQHIGDEVDLHQRFQHGAAEEREPLALVAAGAVDVVAAEILLVVHEIEGDAGIIQLFNAHVLAAPAEVDVEVEHMLHLRTPFLADGLVQGQDDANVLAGLADFLRQCAANVRQSARFDEWDAFGGCEQYFHGKPS